MTTADGEDEVPAFSKSFGPAFRLVFTFTNEDQDGRRHLVEAVGQHLLQGDVWGDMQTPALYKVTPGARDWLLELMDDLVLSEAVILFEGFLHDKEGE